MQACYNTHGERLSRFAQAAFDGCTEVRLTYHTVKKLAKTLRDANFKVLVSGTLTDGVLTVMDVSEKPDAPLYGCAIDIGTTTVTGVLMDLATGTLTAKASAGNGQIRYGAVAYAAPCKNDARSVQLDAPAYCVGCRRPDKSRRGGRASHPL